MTMTMDRPLAIRLPLIPRRQARRHNATTPRGIALAEALLAAPVLTQEEWEARHLPRRLARVAR